MTAVRLRHEDDAESEFLSDVPFADLDTVIPFISKWGICAKGDNYPNLAGQFVYAEGDAAFFEVIICEADE